MRKIESISAIYPSEINFNINTFEEKVIPNSNLDIQVGMIVDELKGDDKNNYRATVSFLMRLAEKADKTILVKISHIIEFTSNVKNFNLEDKADNFILFEIVEPYVRYRFHELLNNTKFSTLDIPYKFWELIGDDSEV
ncbi:hypothetical protein [Streptococcus halitosis]|uniref:hypothetical protein n=1 Tax=Streptococcus halitosis TaxID=2172545 RepID=UPI0022E245A3|nr:hypothetical protein [Streptococcus halitosis]